MTIFLKFFVFIFIVTLFNQQTSYAQAFYGRGDVILQIGADFQSKATGISGSLDFGLADNISIGVVSSYVLGLERVKDNNGNEVPIADFKDRFDIKGRLNAHLGNLFSSESRFDIYPGLYLSTKNFGGHVGVRYFFTYGLGIFSEVHFPISKFDTGTLTPAEKLNNQTTFNIGLAFGI